MPTSNIVKELRNLFASFVDSLDKGNTNISEDDARFLLKTAREIIDPKLNKYQASRYLNMNEKQFDYKVSKGEIPKGEKIAGYNVKFWYKSDLDKIPKDK